MKDCAKHFTNSARKVCPKLTVIEPSPFSAYATSGAGNSPKMFCCPMTLVCFVKAHSVISTFIKCGVTAPTAALPADLRAACPTTRGICDSAVGFGYVASLIPVSVCQQLSELRSVSCLLAFLLQIIQQLPEHEHPESTDMGVHWASLGRFGTIVGSIQRVNRS